MPTSTPRSLRCRRRSCVWLGHRSTPANGGSPYVSGAEARRQADSECLGELTSGLMLKAEGALEHIVSKVVLFWTLSFSSFSFCSSSPSGFTHYMFIWPSVLVLRGSSQSVCFFSVHVTKHQNCKTLMTIVEVTGVAPQTNTHFQTQGRLGFFHSCCTFTDPLD